MDYEILFSPILVGKQLIKNRIVMAPAGTSLHGPGGEVTSEMVDYYEARAKGGTGLIVSPFTAVDKRYRALTLGLYSWELIPGWSRLVEAIHFHDAKFLVQISHFGGKAPRFLTGTQPVAPSAIESPMYPEIPREMTAEEIEEAIELFIRAAVNAKIAGCDGVELHGAHTYLIGQFVSPHSNRRDDEYGGDFTRRMNFVGKIVKGIKQQCGESFIIGYKYSAYEHLENGIDDELAVKIAQFADGRGVDYVHVSSYTTTLSGIVDTDLQAVPSMYHPRGALLPIAEKVKKAVRRARVLGTGGINEPQFAEEILRDDKADMVALGRALIADPDWANKAKSGGIIRHCIRCQVCYRKVLTPQWVKCTINPVACEERRYGSLSTQQAQVPKKVVIIGAGPAGMEAAVRAKQRGHEVTLFEKNGAIGGNLVHASIPDFKLELKMLLQTYEKELKKYGVTVKLNRKITGYNDIRNEKADVVMIGVGSALIIPDVPGIDSDHVFTVLDYYGQRKLDLGRYVLIIGAGEVGLELALQLTVQNKEVKIIDAIGEKEMMADELMPFRLGLITKVKKEGVEILNETQVDGIEENRVLVRGKRGGVQVYNTDSVIIASGFMCNRGEIEKLRNTFVDKVPEVFLIGDCVDPGKLFEAIHSGAHAAWKI
jgi:2,4-dienoyl-CoA reductase-like NADH-dependent reductase (Old Yellow Enzyme family)/thioredoxin reductase